MVDRYPMATFSLPEDWREIRVGGRVVAISGGWTDTRCLNIALKVIP